MNDSLKRFRIVAIAEGWSFLILLFIAMPLKYLFDFPWAVKYTGWVHGILFVAYMITLISVWADKGWKFPKVILAFVVSLIPFGTFRFDRRLSKEA
jgi:integral membrane protein